MGFGKSVSVRRLITVNFGEINERQFQLYDKIHLQKKELHSPGPSALGTWFQEVIQFIPHLFLNVVSLFVLFMLTNRIANLFQLLATI